MGITVKYQKSWIVWDGMEGSGEIVMEVDMAPTGVISISYLDSCDRLRGCFYTISSCPESLAVFSPEVRT